MIAEVKRLTSPDVDLRSFEPADPLNFGFLLEAYVGPVDSAQEDQFQFLVGTAAWLAETTGSSAFFGRDTLVVVAFDLRAIQQLIKSLVETIGGSDWRSIAGALDRYGIWEYRDYVPHQFNPPTKN